MKHLLYWFLTLLCAASALAAFYLVIYEINIALGFFFSIFALGISW